jgi:hypothetical protein
MNWLNIEIKTIRCPEYVGSEPTDRATWINLLVYCAEQENGGIIENCLDWKDRRWQQTCGVTKEEVTRESDLWSWSGSNLTLWAYPAEKEHEVKAKRLGGSNGGKASGEARKAKSARTAQLVAPGEASREAQLEAQLERKGKERKGMEGERNGMERNACALNGSPPEDAFATMASQNGVGGMLRLEAKIQSLKPGWNLPMTRSEQEELMGAARALDGLTDDDWQTIRDYLGAKLEKGSPGWQPRTRSKFIETAPDVWTHASEWKRKQPFKKTGVWR